MQDFLAGELSCDAYEEIKTCCVRESERLKERILTLRGEQHRQSETPTVDNSWLKTFSGLQLPARLNRNLACAPIQRITIYAENKIDVIFKYQDGTWIPDPEAAPVVQRMFKLCSEGSSPTEITKLLNGEGVPTPAQHKRATGSKRQLWNSERTDHFWRATTIGAILRDERYTGKLVTSAKQNQA